MNPIRFSQLKFMSQSPAHYLHALTAPRKQTKPMLFGDALDALVFDTKEVLVFDGASRRTKAWDRFADDNPEAIKLLPSEQETITGMLASLQAHSAAMELLEGNRQQQIKWSMNGRECNGTPDAFTLKRVVELKSARTANPNWFPWDARKMAYHAQLTWYRNGLNAAGLCEPDAECWIVAVESTAPYPVTLFQLTELACLEGTKLWRLWFERLLVCESSNTWPAYTVAPAPFDTPDTDSLTLTIDGQEMEIE